MAHVPKMKWQDLDARNDTLPAPFVDDGTPYPETGLVELQKLLTHIGMNLQKSLQSIRTELDGCTH